MIQDCCIGIWTQPNFSHDINKMPYLARPRRKNSPFLDISIHASTGSQCWNCLVELANKTNLFYSLLIYHCVFVFPNLYRGMCLQINSLFVAYVPNQHCTRPGPKPPISPSPPRTTAFVRSIDLGICAAGGPCWSSTKHVLSQNRWCTMATWSITTEPDHRV